MPENMRYCYLKTVGNQNFNFQMDSSSGKNSDAREALYFRLKNEHEALHPLRSFSFFEHHLSIDRVYFKKNVEMSPEHYTASYLNKTLNQKIIIHLYYSYEVSGSSSVFRAKKISFTDLGEEEKEEFFELTAAEKSQILQQAQPYASLRSQIVRNHQDDSKKIEQQIFEKMPKIEEDYRLLLNCQEENRFMEAKNRIASETQHLISLFEKYNAYNNNEKIAEQRLWTNFSQNINGKVWVDENLVNAQKNDVLTEHFETLSISASSESTTSKTSRTPAWQLRLKQLKQEIEFDVNSIKAIQQGSQHSATQLLEIHPIKERIELNLLMLSLEEISQKKPASQLKEFIIEKEHYIKKFLSVDDCFTASLENGDIEAIEILRPHARFDELHLVHIVIARLMDDLNQSYNPKSKALNKPSPAMRSLEYLCEKYMVCLKFILMIQGTIWCGRRGSEPSEILCSSLMYLFYSYNFVRLFELFLIFSLNSQKEYAAFYSNKGWNLNLAQAIIHTFSSYHEDGMAFIHVLEKYHYFDKHPAQRNILSFPLVSRALIATTANTTRQENPNDLTYFEFFLAVANVHNDSISLLEFFIHRLNFSEILFGWPNLFFRPEVMCFQLFQMKEQCILFYKNHNEFMSNMSEIFDPSASSLGIVFFPKMAVSISFVKTIEHLFQYTTKKFMALPTAEQSQYIVECADIKYIKNTNNLIALGYILMALTLMTLKSSLTAKEYVLRAKLFYLYLVKAKITINKDYKDLSLAQQECMHKVQCDIPHYIWRDIQMLGEEDRKNFRTCNHAIAEVAQSISPVSFFRSSNQDKLSYLSKQHLDVGDDLNDEVLLRALAKKGDYKDMEMFLNINNRSYDLNAADPITGKTAIDEIVENFYIAEPENRDNYLNCFALLLSNGVIYHDHDMDKEGVFSQEATRLCEVKNRNCV